MRALPFLTADLPGCGGRTFVEPEDFRIEEVRRVEPSGRGGHALVRIEKRGLDTPAAARRLARALEIPVRAIGYAGLKDAHAVAIQDFTVEGVEPERVLAAQVAGIRILEAAAHHRRLKRGASAGNRFEVRIRGAAQGARAAQDVLERLARTGVPAAFGRQRFGRHGDNARLGLACLRRDAHQVVEILLARLPSEEAERWRAAARTGDAPPSPPAGGGVEGRLLDRWVRTGGRTGGALRLVDPKVRALWISSWQAAVFNAVLARRWPDLGALHDGDVAWIHRNGACFLVADAQTERARAERFEISPTGPLPGPRCMRPGGAAAAIERSVLAAFGEEEGLAFPRAARGARRPLRFPLFEPSARVEGDDLRLGFVLPPGAYATVVLREVLKTEETLTWAPLPVV